MVLHRNILALGTLSWSSQAADGFAANALGPQTNDFWTPISLPANLSVTLAEPIICDACAVIGHNLGSRGSTLLVQWWNGSEWITSQTLTPNNDRDFLLIFGEQAAALWRIRVTGATAPNISIVMLGKRLLIPNGVQAGYVPINLALDMELSPSVTVRGQYVGTFVKRRGASTSIALAQQERVWIENEAAPFIKHYNEGQPFIWASCPDLLPEDMAYCWSAGRTLRASYGAGAVYGEMGLEVSAYVG